MQAQLEIRALGGLAVQSEGTAVTFETHKEAALLVYLACTGRTHPREALAEMLWEERTQSQALANLRHVLTQLRQRVEPYVTISRQAVAMNTVSRWWLDVADFERQLDAAGEQDVEALETALDLYQGDFLAGIFVDSSAFEDWVRVERERLRFRVMEALDILTSRYLSQREYAKGIARAAELLQMDSLREETYQQMMKLLAQSGQRAQALSQYEICRRLLDEELGVAPMRETVALYEQIQQGIIPVDHPRTTPAFPSRHYIIGEPIGTGPIGTVFHGTDTRSGQPVAIKRLNPGFVAGHAAALERFQREVDRLRQFNHPNIVDVLATYEDAGHKHIVMEYIGGGSLYDLLETAPRLPVTRVIAIALDLADALTHVHRLDIIHGALKPENVLIAEDGSARLTDFGITPVPDSDHLTVGDTFSGTPYYISPEAINNEPPDARTDIWSFGVVLFEMLAGQRPFEARPLSALMTAIQQQPVPDLEELRPDAPVALVDLVYRMLAKAPHERIPSARLVGAELEALLREENAVPTVVGTNSLSPPRLSTAQSVFTPPPADHRILHNLPAQTTAFVGREGELQTLAHLLAKPDVRLITILAPGGMGKTRLALETATRQLNQAPDGAYFVELAPLASPDNIPSAIATATDYPIQQDGRSPRQQIIEFLSNRHLLLVLDNFEHLLDGARLVTDILESAPRVRIIVTSRQRLNQTGETVFALSGMDFPDWEKPEDAVEYSAVQLFLQSARRIQPGYELQADNLTDVARICRLVQGMPLGIILAAAWLDMLSAGEIADEIHRNLDFLESEMSDLPERQRSIRAVFDHSWNLLNEQERDAFMKLSVFRGGFSRQAAQNVSGAGLRVLQALVNKSLLQRHSETGRYVVHELLRQYGEEALNESGQADNIRDAHAQHYLGGVAQLEADIKGRRQRGAIIEMEANLENIRAAWTWAVAQRQEELICGAVETLFLFYDFQSYAVDFMVLRQRALAVFEGRTRGRLLRSLSGSPEASLKADVEEALRIAREYDDLHEICRCLITSGIAWFGSEPQASANLEAGLEISRTLGDEFYEEQALAWLGYQAGLGEQYDRSFDYLSAAIAMSRRTGNKAYLCQWLGARASFMMLANADYSAAAESLREARAISVEIDMPVATIQADNDLCIISWLQGDFEGCQARAANSVQIYKSMDAHSWNAVNFLALALCMQERYQEAEAYALEVASHLTQYAWTALAYFSMLMQACIYWGLNNPQKIRGAIWDHMESHSFLTVHVYWMAPVMAFLSAGDRQCETAAQLLSAAMHHPANPAGGWLDQWPPVGRLRADLLENLGSRDYARAWERGKSLDLETVVRDLLEEFRKAGGP